MNNFNDIKSLWLNQTESAPSGLAEITRLAKKERSRMISKNIAGLGILFVTLIVIGAIILFADFAFPTTKIGAVIAVISVIGAMSMNFILLQVLLKTDNAGVDNQSYLNHLLSYRKKQQFFQQKGMAIYFCLLWIGLTLYMYEFYARNKQFGLIAYGLTMAWIAFNWFYLRPGVIKRQEDRLNTFISQVESVSRQFGE